MKAQGADRRIRRRMDTADAQRFWRIMDRAVEEVEAWPDWKLCGIRREIKRRDALDAVLGEETDDE